MKVYGLKKCSTCLKALTWLDAHSVPYVFIDYREEPIQSADLLAWSEQLGGWDKLVNRASMTWRNLSDHERSAQSEPQWLALIAAYPALVRRPLVLLSDGQVMVGFQEKRWQQALGIA
jgi:Spx/MgsR family transcriptional regulator